MYQKAGENLAIACVYKERNLDFLWRIQRENLALTGVWRSWILSSVCLKFLSLQMSDPDNIEKAAKSILLLGMDAEKRLAWEEAIEHYFHVIDLAPSEMLVLYLGHNNLAYSLLHLERFKEAEVQCLAAIEIDNTRHNAFKNLGLAYEGLGRPVEAAACFINASRRNMTDTRAWLHLQQLLLKNPGLLAGLPELLKGVEGVREAYAANGGVPSLN